MGRTTWAMGRGRGIGGKSQTYGFVEMFGWVRFSFPRADNSVSLH